ncbi:MAG: outer membrane protein assembly factor BamB [Kiritimatiellia bacterium]|jgi:outer membrane protein assembly factor BamB
MHPLNHLIFALVLILVIGIHAREEPAHTSVNVSWRFDGNGGFPHIDPPAKWGPDEKMRWKTPVAVGGYSSPIVVGEKVFLTAEMGSLICLDRSTGKRLWEKDLFSKESKDIPADLSKLLMRGCGGDSKQSTPTPTSNGELVFYINAMGLCACYDLNGQQKWIRIIETAEDEENFSASPVFIGDRILLSWGGLLALDANDGHTIWCAKDALSTYATPLATKIGGEAVALTPAGDIVRLADGEILCAGLFDSTFTTPLIVNDLLYVIDSEAMALEWPAHIEQGMQLKPRWKTRLDGTFMASPICRDGLLYTIEQERCLLHIIDAKTGEVLTTTLKPDGTHETGVKIAGLVSAQQTYASPAATGQHVYFFDDAGHAAVLKLGRSYRPVCLNTLDDALIGTPFFTGDTILIRGNKILYCIGK